MIILPRECPVGWVWDGNRGDGCQFLTDNVVRKVIELWKRRQNKDYAMNHTHIKIVPIKSKGILNFLTSDEESDQGLGAMASIEISRTQ